MLFPNIQAKIAKNIFNKKVAGNNIFLMGITTAISFVLQFL